MHEPKTAPDSLAGTPTRIHGRSLPGDAQRAAILDDHWRRLETFHQLVAHAEECGIRTHPDRDVFLLPEDAVSLLEMAGGSWAALGTALHTFRRSVPLLSLEQFGFSETESPLEDGSSKLTHLGGGVEAWAYENNGNAYKFFRPRLDGGIGSTFEFSIGEDGNFRAHATSGSYRDLLEKCALITALDGMPTEILGVTPEGILVAKQPCGPVLPEGADVISLLHDDLRSIPSRFLHIDRDHPRLFFCNNQAWLIADPHHRNWARDLSGKPRLIDIVAAPIPDWMRERDVLFADWIQRVQLDPSAGPLRESSNDEL